ncbi:P-loop containing nucleoside triphosphate hydrolase protein [Cyathus striatus]|nr:P-loop containing nucleoside triphosphate hydrolase protein [Cyathus striatus]
MPLEETDRHIERRPRPTWKSDRDRMSRSGKWAGNIREQSNTRDAKSEHYTRPAREESYSRPARSESRFAREESYSRPARSESRFDKEDSYSRPARPDTRSAREDSYSHPDRKDSYARSDRAESLPRPARSEYSDEGWNPDTLASEFYDPPSLVSNSTSAPRKGKSTTEPALPTQFTSPPLLPGLLQSLQEFLPAGAKPTAIQALSIKWVLETVERELMERGDEDSMRKWKQYLLASETGSGKSIAYLLPVLQSLKTTEMMYPGTSPPPILPEEGEAKKELALNPRAIVLAPTHELARQLSVFAKSLLHHVKLRVLCASRENTKSRGSSELDMMNPDRKMSSRSMKRAFDSTEAAEGVFEKTDHKIFPVDMVVGTPAKLLEMVRGVGWNHVQVDPKNWDQDEKKLRRGRDMIPIHRKVRMGQPEMGLEKVDWVVVDEADILFDPDFKEQTLNFLSDVARARGAPLPDALSALTILATPSSTTPNPINYPFHLLLTSATIPSALISHLNTYHPTLTRLTSPNLHKLPKTLTTEYVDWTGGNKFADVERRIRQVWKEDSIRQRAEGVPNEKIQLSKVLVFANKSTKVIELGKYLEEHKMMCIKMTSGEGGERMRGSNKPFKTFLKPLPHSPSEATVLASDPAKEPYVLLTTSLLSRGLDFAPEIKHVFIIDEPRNMIDFLHRAGRSGRAGNVGKVVIFGKGKGRGSDRAKDVRKRVRQTIR